MKIEELDQFHAREFEKRFSRFLARVRERYPLPDSRLFIPPQRKLKRGERPKRNHSPEYLAALEMRELEVVDYFLRKTEGERPDSDKLALRTFELQRRGWLNRRGWVLRRFGSEMGTHWAVVPAL